MAKTLRAPEEVVARLREIADDVLGLQPADADPIGLLEAIARTHTDARVRGGRLRWRLVTAAARYREAVEADARLGKRSPGAVWWAMTADAIEAALRGEVRP